MDVPYLILAFIVICLNVVLLVCSIYVVRISLVQAREVNYCDFEDDPQHFGKFTKMIMFIGMFVAALCFLGCFGVIIDNQFCLLLYAVMLGVFIVVEIISIYFLYPNVSKFRQDFGEIMLFAIEDPSEEQIMQKFEETENCCGFNSYRDWQDKRGHIPGSCCDKPRQENCLEEEVANTVGCEEIISSFIENVVAPLPIVFSLIFIVQVILIFCVLYIILYLSHPQKNNLIMSMGPVSRRSPLDSGVLFDESVDTHNHHMSQMAPGSQLFDSQVEIHLIETAV